MLSCVHCHLCKCHVTKGYNTDPKAVTQKGNHTPARAQHYLLQFDLTWVAVQFTMTIQCNVVELFIETLLT